MSWIVIEYYVSNCLARVGWVGFLSQTLASCTVLALHLNPETSMGNVYLGLIDIEFFQLGFLVLTV